VNRDKRIGLLGGLVALAVAAAIGSARARRRRAREHGDLPSTT
jgi:hypothetical protein